MALRPVVISLFLALLAPASANLRLRGIKEHQQSCDCLSWREAYTKYHVQCGDGFELAAFAEYDTYGPAATEIDAMAYGNAFCRFFESMPNNFCMNADWKADNPTGWCYVSAACQAPGTMALMAHVYDKPGTLHTLAKTKFCGPGDTQVKDFTMEQLYDLGKPEHGNLEFGMVSRYALKHAKSRWNYVESELMNTAGPSNSYLVSMVADQKPVMFSAMPWDTDKKDYQIVHGGSVYEGRETPTFFSQDTMPGVASDRVVLNQVTCIKGCSSPQVPYFVRKNSTLL